MLPFHFVSSIIGHFIAKSLKDSFVGNATTCRSVNNHAAMRDVDWVTQNCLVSFDTIGVWPETIDGTDLTMGCKSTSGKYFASGDDFGKLKLYNHPVNKPKVSLKFVVLLKIL